MRFGSSASFHGSALLAVVTLCLGCGDRSAAPSNATQQKRSDPAAAKPAPGDAAAAPEPRGTLKGTVVFDGNEIPAQTMVPIQTDPEVCEKHGADGLYPMEDYVIDRETRGIRHVIVHLKGEAIRKWAGTPRQNAVIDNRNCRFEPHIALATVGSIIEVKNSDNVYHTTHLYGPGGFQYNPGLRAKGESEQTELTRPGTYVVKCDRHGWMSAFLRVDEQGRFEITGIPPGKHQVEVFHEKFGERPIPPEVIEVTIEADKTSTLDLKLSH
jgi:plastocyanin